MSTDYYLFSPSQNRAAMVGSIGIGGIQSFPAAPEVVEFIRWAIENSIEDVGLVDEHEYHEAMERGGVTGT